MDENAKLDQAEEVFEDRDSFRLAIRGVALLDELLADAIGSTSRTACRQRSGGLRAPCVSPLHAL